MKSMTPNRGKTQSDVGKKRKAVLTNEVFREDMLGIDDNFSNADADFLCTANPWHEPQGEGRAGRKEGTREGRR